MRRPSEPHRHCRVVVQRRGRIALFKGAGVQATTAAVGHCITGYLEAGATPEQQVLEELYEETGLQSKDLLNLRQGTDLEAQRCGDSLPRPLAGDCALTGSTTPTGGRPHKAKRFTSRVSWSRTCSRQPVTAP